MVLRLVTSAFYKVPIAIEEQLGAYPIAFNPSYVKNDTEELMAIRVYNSVKKRVEALVYYWSQKETFVQLNLTNYIEDKGFTHKVADPKLFVMEGETWGTYNTGYVEGGANQIFLFKLEKGAIVGHYECISDARNTIEKNWAFYKENGQIYVLYGLSPLTLLKQGKITANTIVFTKAFEDKAVTYKNHTIGTQLARFKDHYYFIGHKKKYWKGKRLYYGVAFRFDPVSKQLFKYKFKLIHSFKALLGSKPKLNPNLISCTYFSGLSIENETAYIGYGINDNSWKITPINLNKIWQ